MISVLRYILTQWLSVFYPFQAFFIRFVISKSTNLRDKIARGRIKSGLQVQISLNKITPCLLCVESSG